MIARFGRQAEDHESWGAAAPPQIAALHYVDGRMALQGREYAFPGAESQRSMSAAVG